MPRTILGRLKNIAKKHDADIEYNKKEGYFLVLNDKKTFLAKDSIDAVFALDKLLKPL